MTRKFKKELTKEIMNEAKSNYDYSQILDIPIEELIGIEAQKPSDGSRSLPKMAAYIENSILTICLTLPDNVLESPLKVTCNDFCEIPMDFMGAVPTGHEFGCGANPGECIFESTCPQSRIVDFDSGHLWKRPPLLLKVFEKIFA